MIRNKLMTRQIFVNITAQLLFAYIMSLSDNASDPEQSFALLVITTF